MKVSTNFSTPELSLATALLSTGYCLDHLEREKDGRVLFVFCSSGGLLDVVQQFWQKQLLANVHTYYENLKFLKARLRNGTPETKD